ncbi:MAG: peptide deformylase [Rhizobiales bacterium]|nr:peptide deformylase [Hyphomicrobiales bacterium]MBL6770138.1 peptide deformylase [Hyphomicrobiales bacterium]
MIYQILTIPNKILRERSEEVTNIDRNIIKTLDNMAETMYAAPGIGLAAIQVGIKKRLVVIDCDYNQETKKNPHYFINPEIIWKSEEKGSYKEGCLSIPEYYEEVERPSKCKVRFLDKKGITKELDCEGILATCIQHEIDHLDGKLFIDYLSRLKKSSIEKKFKKSNKRKN